MGNFDDPNLAPPAVPPFALPYSSLGPTRPPPITVISVIGIVMASLGLLAAATGVMSAIVMAAMSRTTATMMWSQTPGATAVAIAEAVVGAGLAVGSIALLRLRPWSRRLLIQWAWIYLATAAIFLLLQIMIVVPNQVAMFTNIMKSMPAPGPVATPATMPVAAPAPAGSTAPASGVAVTSSTSGSYTTFSSSTFVTTTTTTPSAAAAANAAMVPIMKVTYMAMAIGRTIICLIFPIAVLIVLSRPSVRAALAEANG